MKLQKNVPNNDVQDITWRFSCTIARVENVAGAVKSLHFSMEKFEKEVQTLTEEMSKLKESVLALSKENEKESKWSEIDVPPKNEKRSRWSDIEVMGENEKRHIWSFPWTTTEKNNDSSFLLRE